ncbi:hypothetical protein ILUMI_12780 [Ignelater luminosus]|uniref:Uncharacterized protein n=1 Tax=Ignelater luminosus TaxID=2038154 RepID=A0A8K0GC03_IGNLU|nr:hypothetical protein ILUMI_12780 [Ignelater luminosus]
MGIFALPRICSLAWDRAVSSQNIKSGFRATGILPFDHDIFKDFYFMFSFISDDETHPVASTRLAESTYAGLATVSTTNHSAQATRVSSQESNFSVPFQLNLAWKIR